MHVVDCCDRQRVSHSLGTNLTTLLVFLLSTDGFLRDQSIKTEDSLSVCCCSIALLDSTVQCVALLTVRRASMVLSKAEHGSCSSLHKEQWQIGRRSQWIVVGIELGLHKSKTFVVASQGFLARTCCRGMDVCCL